MDFNLTEEQKQILALIRDFCKRELDEKEMKQIDAQMCAAGTLEEVRAAQPWHIFKKLSDIGLRQLFVPEEYGGGGMEPRGAYLTRAILSEEFGYHWNYLGRMMSKLFGAASATVMSPLMTLEQKDWWFKQFMKDHTQFNCLWDSEETPVTDRWLQAPKTAASLFAQKEGNEWVLNGEKMWSSTGAIATILGVVARTKKEGPFAECQSRFLFLRDTPGVTLEITKMIHADCGQQCQIHCDNVRLSDFNMIGPPHSEFVPPPGGGPGRMSVTATFAALLGGAQALYEKMVQYCKDRVGGGRPIIQHSNVARLLGEGACALESTRSLLYRACTEADQLQLAGKPLTAWNRFLSQAFITQSKKTALQIALIGNELYGGMGAAIEAPLDEFHRHAFMQSHADGTIDTCNMVCSTEYNDHQVSCQTDF